jgi:hypothetical protein
MTHFCGGNLQTAEKPSLFPLSCCDTPQNTAQPKTHCRCVSRSGPDICVSTKCRSGATLARDSGRAIGRTLQPCSAGNGPSPSGPDREDWVRVRHSLPEWFGHREGPRAPRQCQDSTRLNRNCIKPSTVLALSRHWPGNGLLWAHEAFLRRQPPNRWKAESFPFVLLRHAAEHVGTKDPVLMHKSFWFRDMRLK